MFDDLKTCQLIIRQRPVANPELETLLQILQCDFGVDSYTARQRLIGPALALFSKGSPDKTAKLATLLQHYGFACWRIEPQKPAFAPDLLRSLEVHDDALLLTCQKSLVRLERGATVVGVLADLSGGLADKQVKRLLAQNAYRGSNALEVLSHDEMIRSTLQGQPVFDFYLLDQIGKVRHAVQVMPGRFNVEGLGSRAAMSSVQNLQALIRLVEEYAGSFRLHCDFGLSRLPGCDVRKAADSLAAAMENLDSLTRYGWLVSQLQGDGRPVLEPRSGGAAAGSGSALPGTLSGPMGHFEAMPGLAEVSRELHGNPGEGDDRPVAQASGGGQPGGRDLPAPPERPPAKPSWGRLLIFLGMTAAGFLTAANGGELLRSLAGSGMAAGVFPAVAAVPLLWSGFYFIRLKRLVENTPTSKIRSLAMGLVEVHGRTRRLYALVAPMTQSACAWYRLRKYRKDNKNHWKLVKELNSNHVPFQLDDGTGRVVVDPAGAAVRAKAQHSGYPGQSPLTFTAFGSRYSDDEKWVEDIIYEGTSLYVLGFAQPLRVEKMSLRERTLARLRQLKLDPQALRRYDADGDGRIDAAEWEAARTDAERDALQDILEEQGVRKRQEDYVVITRPPQRSLPFIVAETVSEAHLSSKYGWLSLLLLLGGGAAAVLAFYQFLQFMKF